MTAIAFRRRLFALLFSAFAVMACGVFGAGARAEPYDDGMRAYEAGDFPKALELWGPMAENGDAIAQYSLGKLLENGAAGVPSDLVAAAKWYRRSAGQGITAAQNNLGLMYAQGRGVPQDVTRAAELWRAASEKDHVIAQFNLALAYFRGEGVREDRPEALRWFRRAGDLGLANAQYALGQVIRMGLAGEADQAEALYWYELAAGQGHVKAETQAQELRAAGVRARTIQAAEAPAPQPSQTATAPVTAPVTAPAAPPSPLKPAPKPAPKPAIVAAPVPQPEPAPVIIQAPTPQAPTPQVAVAPSVTAPAPSASAPSASAPSASVPSASGEGAFSAWLISLNDAGAARRYLAAAETKHPEIFAQAPGRVAAAKPGRGGTFHRVLAGGLASRAAARDLCQRLRAAAPGAFCKVLEN
jgi:hypothetical protein